MASDPYKALRNKEFRLFLMMRMCLTLAVQMQAVVVSWQIYELTGHDTLALGMLGLTEAVPNMLISLYAGHMVDMHSRRKILIKVIALLFLASVFLSFFSFEVSKMILSSPVIPIFLMIFITGLARGFIAPTNFAFMTQIVDEEELPNAIAWNSSNWQAAAVAGPAIGGLVYGFFGLEVAYLLQTLLFGLALVSTFLIAPKPAPEYPEEYDLKERLLSGLKFVFSNQIILAAITLDLFAVLFGGAVALLPAFASEVLNTDAKGLGFLRSAPAIGSVLMGVLLAYYPIRRNAGNIMLYCVAGFGFCMIFFAISTNFWLSLFLLFASGLFDSVSVIIRTHLLQNFTPTDMKGRVSAVNSIFISSSNEIGAFESGVAARLMGLIPSVVFGGVMTLLVVATTAFKSKKLRRLDL